MIKLQGRSRIINYDEKLVIRRDEKSAYHDGKILAPKFECFEIHANVQPLGARDLLLVPEGDRFKEMYWVWSEFPMQSNDTVIRDSVHFQVQSVNYWGSYTQSRMVRIDVGPQRSQ